MCKEEKSRKCTNSLELSPSWEAISCSDTPEFPNILRNPKLHYPVYYSSTVVPIPSQSTPSYFSKTAFLNLWSATMGQVVRKQT
jgi:hypothetical protein